MAKIMCHGLFSNKDRSPYSSGDVCGFLAMAWRSDIPSTPTLAANVPISGLLRRGGCTGGAGEQRNPGHSGGRNSKSKRMVVPPLPSLLADHINGSSGPTRDSNDQEKEARSRPCVPPQHHTLPVWALSGTGRRRRAGQRVEEKEEKQLFSTFH
uniref:Uncharacterized protein n=1 Tax=Knipowitschia caucasica TaxID=637954 RepID=A0AAV2MRF5_KNICA